MQNWLADPWTYLSHKELQSSTVKSFTAIENAAMEKLWTSQKVQVHANLCLYTRAYGPRKVSD